MGDNQLVELSIHYGGTMKKEDDGYNYICRLGCKSICWKLSEIRWLKFEDFLKSVNVPTPISLIWFKEASEETKMMKYVFDKTSDNMVELRLFTEAYSKIDVYIEHDCSEHVIGEANAESCKWEIDGGYEPDEDEIRAEEGSEYGDDNSDEGDMPPKEDDEPEESEDETPAGGNQNDSEGLNVNQTELDDGDEVVIDAGDGHDDDRFQSVFVEGSWRNAELDEATRKLAEEQAAGRKEDEVETDPQPPL